jgi:hypothetical protein
MLRKTNLAVYACGRLWTSDGPLGSCLHFVGSVPNALVFTDSLSLACRAGTYGGSVAGAKVSVNDSETVRPVIDHLLWFHSGEQSDIM